MAKYIVNLFGHGSSGRSLDQRESTVHHLKFAKYLHLLKLVLYCQTSLTQNSVDHPEISCMLKVFHVNSTTCYTWAWAWVWLEIHVKRYFMLSSFMLTRFDCIRTAG